MMHLRRSRLRCSSVGLLLLLSLSTLVLTSCARPSGAPSNRAASLQSDRVVGLDRAVGEIVYVVQVPTGPGGESQRYSMYALSPDTGDSRLLLSVVDPEAGRIGTFILPGGRRSIVHMSPPGNAKIGADYIAGLDGSHPRFLAHGSVCALFPDGRLLISTDVGALGEGRTLYTGDSTGRHLEQLTARPQGSMAPSGPDGIYRGDTNGSVSPDGRLVAFETTWGSTSIDRSDVSVVNADGSGRRRLTDSARTGLSYKLGGFAHLGYKMAILESGKRLSLLVMDVTRKATRRFFLQQPVGRGVVPTLVGWSADDRTVAAFTPRRLSVISTRDGSRRDLLVLPEDQGDIISASWND